MQSSFRPELTIRAVLTGMALGALLTPCNIYSGLKIGWGFNMSIAAGLLAFGFWRLGEHVGGAAPWGIYENNINQTAASSSSSIISGGLVAPIPALALLTGQQLPWPLLVFWVFSVSALGIVVAAGLRNQMLLRENLRFPAGVATAETMQQIHAHGAEAMQRLRILFAGAFVAAGAKLYDGLIATIPRAIAPFSLPAMGLLRGSGAPGVSMGNLGFALDPSLLMLGFGIIIGFRTGLSLLIGAVFGWGVLAPIALAHGWAEAGAADPDVSWFGPLVEWLLWPGASMMVVSALTAFGFAFARYIVNRKSAAAPDEPRTIPRSAFIAGFAAALVLASVAQVTLFGIGIGEAVFAVLLSFVLAVVAARVAGETGITPVGAIGKITQLTFGVVTPGNMTANLMTANVSGGAAGQCADLLHDLRTGQIIGATPGFQIVAQLFGVLTGSLVGSLVYIVIIPDPRAMLITPEWPAPAVATWKAVAEVLAAGFEAIPEGAVAAMILAGCAGAVLVAADRVLPPRLSRYLPSAPAIGLAFVIPAWNSISLFLGGLAALIISRFFPNWAEKRLTALAAGLVAGESLAGVGLAMSQLIG
jgi:putative OPT family oligopeptide transporter